MQIELCNVGAKRQPANWRCAYPTGATIISCRSMAGPSRRRLSRATPFCRANGPMETRVELTLAMPVERVMPHPSIRQTAGQIALQRGPLVYCLEEVDNGARLANVCIPESSELTDVLWIASLFGGVVGDYRAGASD